MNELQTILGTDIPTSTRGILYLCHFTGIELVVLRELLFDDAFVALEAYANIPNPESQLVTSRTYNGLIKELHILHKQIKDPEWLEELSECL